MVQGEYSRPPVETKELLRTLANAREGKGYANPNPGGWLESRDLALLCILAVYGKRITECVRLKRDDLQVKDGSLVIRFRVQKILRKGRTDIRLSGNDVRISQGKIIINLQARAKIQERADQDPADRRTQMTNIVRLKPVDVNNPLVHPILAWMKMLADEKETSVFLFPTSRPNLKTQREYLSPKTGLKIVKRANPNLWPHWLRHSLAVGMASREDLIGLMDWFDWVKPETAYRYILAGMSSRIRDMGKQDYWGVRKQFLLGKQ